MNRATISGILVFLLLVTVVFAVTLTREQRIAINECNGNCGDIKKAALVECRLNGLSCTNSCKDNYNGCKEVLDDERTTCMEECQENYYIGLSQTNDSKSKRNLSLQLNACRKDCRLSYTQNKNQYCKLSECMSGCAQERTECNNNANEDFRICTLQCKHVILNDNVTCNGDYLAGQSFTRGCDLCQCTYDGIERCAQTALCHYTNATIEQQLCEDNGGLYQQLCTGNIYAMRCTEEFFCLCNSNYNFTCPSEYQCVDEFKTYGILKNHNVWTLRSGVPLGNEIGICAQKPELESCGNGICENIVCQGGNCTVAESSINCPEDCGEGAVDTTLCSKKVEADVPVVCTSTSLGYEFDELLGQCVEKELVGCGFVPFNTMEACESVCETQNN